MKNIQKIALLGIIGIPAVLTDTQAALIAHYKLDEASGATTAFNELGTGVGFDGTVVNATSGVTGVSGTAYQFNGASGTNGINSSRIFVTAPAFASAVGTSQALTISAWLLRTGTTGTPAVASFGNSGASDQYYQLAIENSGTDAFARAVNRSVNFEKALGNDAINDGVFHHLVATVSYNGTDTFLQLYVDGVLDAERTVVGDVPPDVLNVFTIGALVRSSGVVDSMVGAIDDVQIYDEVLNPAQIGFLTNNPGVAVPEPGTAVLSLLCLPVLLRRRR